MFLLRALSRLPFPVLFLLSDLLFFLAYHIVRYRRWVVYRNIHNSFPDMSESEMLKIERVFYRNLCDYIVETLKLLTITPEELKRRMFYKNPEVIQQCKDENTSALFLASHQFNWEWMIAAANLWLPVTVDFVYQPQSSALVDKFSLQTRGRFGSHAIKRTEVIREMIRRKDIIRGIANVADQFPGNRNDKRYWTKFLNQETAFFEGVNNMAIMMQYPVFSIRVNRVKRGFYEMEFVKIGEPPYEKGSFHIIKNYVKQTEAMIHNDPAGWLWSHNRWKKKRTDFN